ncbi:hypothetical protein ACS5PN_13175 [Roseateles sp. NT4]|uniref:hypothetical protein n=1 Tax=Roseateles sp. NT4 TaxID=3453715 RepID=UPI003EEC510C
MSGISAIQALNPGEAWQAFLQAAVNEAEAPPVAQSEATAEAPQAAAPLPAQAAPQTRPADMPASLMQRSEAAAVVIPAAPVLMQPLSLQNGPELRWRVQDAPAWRQLFDEAGSDAQEESEAEAAPPPAFATAEEIPAWARALLAQLREAAADAPSSAALRPALQAWRLGLPVLLASPVGLASLQPSRDATTWLWRRWPAHWRTARPTVDERWWAVRVGLSAQGRPRTLRELAGSTRLAPGQVSCELRLDDVAPGISQWAEVLVQAQASTSLRALLGARNSLTWLLCSEPLWPKEGP